MFIKFGFQRDYGNIKVDLGQDEVDLARILAEHSIPVDAVLTSEEAFHILRLSTEMLYLRELAHVVPKEAGVARQQYRELDAQFRDHVGKVKARLGIG